MCTRIYEHQCDSLSFQLMWSVEEVHVSHMISIRRMSKRLSNQPTTGLIMHAGTARVMRNQPKIEDMSHWSFHNNRFLSMTQEMNPRIASIQYVRLFRNVTSSEM